MKESERTNRVSSLEELLYPQAPATTGSFDLTEEEKEAAIREAQRKKIERIMYDQDKLRRDQWEKELMRPWSPNDMKVYIEWRASQRNIDLEIDDHNRDVIKALCQYFTSSEKFTTAGEGFSLNKGLMLCGPVGTGKTTLMTLFCSNQRQSFQLISCRDVANAFKTDGEGALYAFAAPHTVPSSPTTFWQRTIGMCFDDLGTEGVKRNFGDQVNVMADILLNRYDKKIPYHFTHVTTNLTPEEIEQSYGDRVRSRMREMFNMVVLGGSDRRK